MTFHEARQKHLVSLSNAWKELWALASDPTWVNKDCTEYNIIKLQFERALRNIIDVNITEEEASK